MAYSRVVEPVGSPSTAELSAAMTGIGMLFAVTPAPNANIEDTLLFASMEGLDRDDYRVLAVLMSWLERHSARINADRLVRLVSLPSTSARVRAFWAAFATWQRKDARFRRLAALHHGERADLLAAGTEFQLRRHGEDERLKDTPLRVPANVLRDRAADILSPLELAQKHLTYRFRVLMGPSYRADMFAELTRVPSLSAAELARRTHGSFATAWQVRRDFSLLHGRAHASA